MLKSDREGGASSFQQKPRVRFPCVSIQQKKKKKKNKSLKATEFVRSKAWGKCGLTTFPPLHLPIHWVSALVTVGRLLPPVYLVHPVSCVSEIYYLATPNFLPDGFFLRAQRASGCV
jgi:hypothetical protein